MTAASPQGDTRNRGCALQHPGIGAASGIGFELIAGSKYWLSPGWPEDLAKDADVLSSTVELDHHALLLRRRWLHR